MLGYMLQQIALGAVQSWFDRFEVGCVAFSEATRPKRHFTSLMC